MYIDRIYVVKNPPYTASGLDRHDVPGNPLHEAFSKGLQQLPEELLSSLGLNVKGLLADLPDSYTIYLPMLLLTRNTFATPTWQILLASAQRWQLDALYTTVAKAIGVTHIAQNAPIPPSTDDNPTSADTSTANILRSPTGLKPLHGYFGKPLIDFDEDFRFDSKTALWVSTRQNGIVQTWAPFHTMFSRGNITEKTRLLTLPSISQAVAEGEAAGTGCTAVDLYAGIGYFAFCYAKAGVKRVLCWELNPWSVEGLKRGAVANRWGVTVVIDGDEWQAHRGQGVLRVYQESNERAGKEIERLRKSWGERLPPIRHVNCGLLPSSRGSWRTAVEVVDPGLGGWIHVHENIAVREIEGKAEEVLEEIQRIFDGIAEKERSSTGSELGARKAVLEHIQKVKTYAPGVMHCVLDIWIPPRSSSNEDNSSRARGLGPECVV